MSTHPPHDSHLPTDAAAPPALAVDPAQESLVQALRASFNILRVLMIVMVVLYLFSGIFRVQEGQQGLVARFGELRLNETDEGETPVFGPGWHPALPDPFDRKYVVTNKVLELKVTHFMFQHEQAASAKNLAEILPRLADLQPGVQGAMLTGDKNLSHGRWEIQYRIRDAARFVQNVSETPEGLEPLLQRLTETAVVCEVAGRTIEEVTREAIDSVRTGVRKRLQAALDRLETGVEVIEVVAYTIEPGAVREAFLDVTRAMNQKLSAKDKAEEIATEILNRAAGDRETYERLLAQINAYGEAQLRGATGAELDADLAEIDAALLAAEQGGAGQVAVRLRTARAAADGINERVQREYEQFQRYLELREVQPRIALLGLWNQMRREILGNRQNEIFLVPEANEIEILINRDPQRQIELEEERTLQRQRGGQPSGPARRTTLNK